MFFGIDALFSTRLPHRFECGFIDFESDNGDRGGPGGGKGGGGVGGGDHGTSGSSGSSSGGSRGGGLGGGADTGDGHYEGSWESAARDKAKGYPGSGGYNVGSTGYNDGNISLGDMSGLGFTDKAKVGLHVAKDNPGQVIGALGGFVFGGLPGFTAGKVVGGMVDKARSGWSAKALAKAGANSLPSVAASLVGKYGTPAMAMGTGLVANAIDPDTKMSSHIGMLIGAGLGGAKLGGKYGAMAGAALGQVAGNLAPAGAMNPQNSDLSSTNIDVSGLSDTEGGESAWGGIAASNVSAIGDSTALVANRAKAIRQAGQWQDYQDRFHS